MKVDLHTHSMRSKDGGISQKEYTYILDSKMLDCIAITDHNEIAFAKTLHKKLGSKIIVGEEIATEQGEIIGLFLKKKISPGQSLKRTVQHIQSQEGIVYIPHPFETRRKGLTFEAMNMIVDKHTLIEAFNARSFSSKNKNRIIEYCKKHSYSYASSSDAHCRRGIGTAFSEMKSIPTNKTIVALLSNASYKSRRAPVSAYLCPVVNR